MGICSKNILLPVAALTGAALCSSADMEVFRLDGGRTDQTEGCFLGIRHLWQKTQPASELK